MRKLTLALLLLLASNPLRADEARAGAADAASNSINMSMVGWGVGLTAGIATLVVLIPPDQEGTTHAHGS